MCPQGSSFAVHKTCLQWGRSREFSWGRFIWDRQNYSGRRERVDNAVNRVDKLTTTTKVAVGQAGRGGITPGRRGGGRRGGLNNNNSGGRQQQYNRHGDYNNDCMPNGSLTFGRFNENISFGCNNGGGCGNGGYTSFKSGSTGHHAKQCPKAL